MRLGARRTGLALAALPLLACGAAGDAAAEPPRNVVLVVVDTLRADHLGCYGYPRDTSPFLDELAAGGVLFENAFCNISTTAPSHASLFTSLYPMEHGVQKNGHVLRDRHATLAELLRERGFLTAGFVSSTAHFTAGNLAQGFEHFDEPEGDDDRRGMDTVVAAARWLANTPPDRPLFLFVHLFDPHLPYGSPAVTVTEPLTPEQEELTAFLVGEQRIDLSAHRHGRAAMLTRINAYDAEIAHADDALRRLHRKVGRARPDEPTLWIVTADHGEGLGTHRWQGHGKHIYNEQLRVPLVFRFGDRADGPDGGRRVHRVVESVDLLPTVLELLRLPPHGPSRGASFADAVLGEDGDGGDGLAFAQRRVFDGDSQDRNYEAGSKYAVQDRRAKYILRTDGPDELYVVGDDPYESRDVAGDGSEEEARLRAALLAWIEDLATRSEGEAELVDEETLERLEALGYIR